MCQLLHLVGLASHHDDFQAIVIVQVNMLRGYDQTDVVVLNSGEAFREVPTVVVIDQDDSACHFLSSLSLLTDQTTANKIAGSL